MACEVIGGACVSVTVGNPVAAGTQWAAAGNPVAAGTHVAAVGNPVVASTHMPVGAPVAALVNGAAGK